MKQRTYKCRQEHEVAAHYKGDAAFMKFLEFAGCDICGEPGLKPVIIEVDHQGRLVNPRPDDGGHREKMQLMRLALYHDHTLH